MIKQGLTAWNSMINKNPDIFNDQSMFLVLNLLNSKPGDDVIVLTLQHLKHATLLHEFNRQNIMNSGVLSSLKPLLKSDNAEVS